MQLHVSIQLVSHWPTQSVQTMAHNIDQPPCTHRLCVHGCTARDPSCHVSLSWPQRRAALHAPLGLHVAMCYEHSVPSYALLCTGLPACSMHTFVFERVLIRRVKKWLAPLWCRPRTFRSPLSRLFNRTRRLSSSTRRRAGAARSEDPLDLSSGCAYIRPLAASLSALRARRRPRPWPLAARRVPPRALSRARHRIPLLKLLQQHYALIPLNTHSTLTPLSHAQRELTFAK